MATNGIISFGVEFPHFSAALFPTESAATYFDFAVAPYWADNDARLNGRVSWEMYSTGDSQTTDDIIERINEFINENEDSDFAGNFTFIGTWTEMHPFPAGASAILAAPYLEQVSGVSNGCITSLYLNSYYIQSEYFNRYLPLFHENLD